MGRIYVSRISLFLVVAFGALGMTFPALSCRADEVRRSNPVGVVELFTSQGCSSCPKADASFAKFADRPDVVAISYHVDYWNYLGWKDTLSVKENTERQYSYAKSLGSSNVFTPQIVLNGVLSAKSSAFPTIITDLDDLKRNGHTLDVAVSATLSADNMSIQIGSGQGRADVVVAYFKRNTTVAIDRGENVGKTMFYRNAVTKIETVGMWDGHAVTLKLPADLVSKRGYDGCAILLQAHDAAGNPGRIYGAAAL
jgi:hypothetical protein